MLNLLKYELRKHLSRFSVIFVSVMLVLSLTVVCLEYADQLAPEADVIREAQENLLDDYINDREKYDADFTDYQVRLDEYKAAANARSASGEWRVVELRNEKIDLENYNDQRLYYDVNDIIKRTEGYNDAIEKVLLSSYSKIKEIGIQHGNYVYDYQAALIRHYTPLAELDVPTEAVYGWEEFFSLKTPVIFLAITMLGTLVSMFILEKRVKILNILHISRNGGWKLVAAKLMSTGIYSTVLTLLFTLTPLAVLALTTGLSRPTQYVQAMESLRLCPYQLTIWQYLMLFILVKIVVFIVFALFIAVLGQLVGSELVVLSASSVFMLLSYLLSTVSDTSSPLFNLRQFNFFDTAFVGMYFERYRAVNLLGTHVGLIPFMTVTIAVIAVVLAAVSFAVRFGSKLMTSQRVSLIGRLKKQIKKREKKQTLAREGSMSVLRYEFDKNLLNSRGIIIVAAALAVKIVISAVSFIPVETNEDKIYKDYISNLGGEITQAQDDYINEEGDYINKSLSEYAEAELEYQAKTMSYEDFRTYTERKNYAELVERPYSRLMQRQMYLKMVLMSPEGYDNIEYVYEEGVMKYLFSFFDAVLVMLALALLTDIFSREYSSGFIMIMNLTKNGGRKTFAAKYLFGFIVVTVMYLLFSAVDIVFLMKNYDINYLHAGLMSIPDMREVGWNITVGQYLVLYKIISYLGFLLLGCMMTSISTLTKNILISAIVSLGIVFIPAFVGYFGVDAIDWVNITNVLNPSYVARYIPQYVICALASAVLFVLARRKWVKN